MKTSMLAVLAVLVAACQQPGSDQLTEAQRGAIAEEVVAAVDGLFEAMNGHDAEDVMARYLNSPDFVYTGCTAFRISWDAYAWIVRQWHPRNQEITFEHEVVRTNVLGPAAAVATIRGSSSESPHLFWTQVWVKRAGTWLVASEHESWPGCSAPSVHPETG